MCRRYRANAGVTLRDGDSQGGELRFSPLSAVARTWFAQAFPTGNTTGLPVVVYRILWPFTHQITIKQP